MVRQSRAISSDDAAARILTLINGKEVKTAIAQAGAVITVGDELPNIYVGEKSGVDFTGFEDSLTIDSSDGRRRTKYFDKLFAKRDFDKFRRLDRIYFRQGQRARPN